MAVTARVRRRDEKNQIKVLAVFRFFYLLDIFLWMGILVDDDDAVTPVIYKIIYLMDSMMRERVRARSHSRATGMMMRRSDVC